jgi:hypothetical protein
LLKKVDPNFVMPSAGTSMNTAKASDIQTMVITQKTIKKFVEIFNSTTFGDFQKNVYN